MPDNSNENANSSDIEFFEGHGEKFPIFFNRVLSLFLRRTVDLKTKSQLILFVKIAFEHTDSLLVRKQVGPLIAIGLWNSVSEKVRQDVFREYPWIKKTWNGSQKHFDRLDEEDPKRAEIQFQRTWLFSVVLDFMDIILKGREKEEVRKRRGDDEEFYVERVLELFITIVSQLPTRRFANTLFKDMNLMGVLRYSKGEAKAGLDLIELLGFYINFPFDDFNGEPLSEKLAWQRHEKTVKSLQLIAFKKYPSLKVLALANFSSIHNRVDLEEHLSVLSLDELLELAEDVGIRFSYPSDRMISKLFKSSRDILIECFIDRFELKRTVKEISRVLEIYPDESILTSSLLDESSDEYENTLTRRPLPSHKLALQYLNVEDLLIRSFHLWRLELMYQMRNDLLSIGSRLKPRLVLGGERGIKRKRGKKRRNLIGYGGNEEDGEDEEDEEDDVDSFSIHEESRLHLDGSSKMAVKIVGKPVILDISPPLIGHDHPAYVRIEAALDLDRANAEVRKEWESIRPGEVVFLVRFETADPKSSDVLSRLGIKYIRCGEFVRILDEKDKEIRGKGDIQYSGRRRKMHIDVDSRRYVNDGNNVVHGFNVVIRRKSRENNFKSVLDTVNQLLNSDTFLPSWLMDVFLGFGNPEGASRIDILSNWTNFGYTFSDSNHIKETFPNAVLKEGELAEGLQYKIREAKEGEQTNANVEVDINKTLNNWKKPNNEIRFTPCQVESIFNGVHKGLTVVVGPPGTGKTDVATQILNIVYHNYPQERTLVIAHSNQALNHIFEKLLDLGIPEHRLVRLGHGEEQLESSTTSSSFSKLGRIENILKSRRPLLQQVDQLVELMGVTGAYGDSCETAGEFFSAYVEPAWNRYNEGKDGQISFPFEGFIKDAENQNEVTYDYQYLQICEIFEKLSSIRPYELLSSNKERSNYLLTHESRVLAMTATYAAMNRQELINLGFKYNNVIMEECGQITEIETFIPLTIQKDINNLHRIVLIGDHHQNAPIIQSNLLNKLGHLDQSLFSRLIRLGVPTVNLESQGRARPEIANLYNWVYGGLKNLPHTNNYDKFNAGFYHTYQFININDYNGQGETEPSRYFYQNLGEAEYSVALYQYMRLLGYPKEKISILSTYYGQKVLIEEILKKKCTNSDIDNKIFGLPAAVSTVDQYQGEENDYIILSLVRTKSIGYLRDKRRLTVALSRARLGLYILGRKDLITSSPDIEEFVHRMINDQTTHDLLVVPGELFKKPIDPRQGIPMQGVAHLGQYVHEMTLKRYEYEQKTSS